MKNGVWVLYLQLKRSQGVQLYWFHSKKTLLYVIGLIMGGGGMM